MVVDGKWTYDAGRTLDQAKTEDFKTRFYKFEGWNLKTATRPEQTKKMGMKKVADVMQSKASWDRAVPLPRTNKARRPPRRFLCFLPSKLSLIRTSAYSIMGSTTPRLYTPIDENHWR